MRKPPIFAYLATAVCVLSAFGPFFWLTWIEHKYGPLPGEAATVLILTPLGLLAAAFLAVLGWLRRERFPKVLILLTLLSVAPLVMLWLWGAALGIWESLAAVLR